MTKDFKSQADIFLKGAKKTSQEKKPGKDITIKLEKKEHKSKKVLIAMQPSLFDKVQQVAKKNKISLNDTFCQLLVKALEQ